MTYKSRKISFLALLLLPSQIAWSEEQAGYYPTPFPSYGVLEPQIEEQYVTSAPIVTEVFEQKVPTTCTSSSLSAPVQYPLEQQVFLASDEEINNFVNNVYSTTDQFASASLKTIAESSASPEALPEDSPSPLPTSTEFPPPLPKPTDSPQPPKRCCACVSYKNGYYPDYDQYCSGFKFNEDCDVELRYNGQINPPQLPSNLVEQIKSNSCSEARIHMYHHGNDSMCKPLMTNVLGCLQAIQKNRCTGYVQVVNHGCQVFGNKQELTDAASTLAAACPTGMSCTIIGHGSNALLPSPENVAYEPLCEADGDGFCNVPAINVKVENLGVGTLCPPEYGLPNCSDFVGVKCAPSGNAVPDGQTPCYDQAGKAKLIECSAYNGMFWTWKIVGDWVAPKTSGN